MVRTGSTKLKPESMYEAVNTYEFGIKVTSPYVTRFIASRVCRNGWPNQVSKHPNGTESHVVEHQFKTK